MKDMDYVMFYFHINDLIEESSKFMSKAEFEDYFKEKGTFKNRVSRYVKTNIGKGSSRRKLDSLMVSYRFDNIENIAGVIDWNNQPIINL